MGGGRREFRQERSSQIKLVIRLTYPAKVLEENMAQAPQTKHSASEIE